MVTVRVVRSHYCASQDHTMGHDDRERYTLQCLTAPHRTTGGQRKKHTLQCLTWQGQVRTRDRCFQVFDVPLFLLASTLKICFQKYPTPVCMFTHCTFDSSAFSAEETLISVIVLSHCGKGCDGGWGIDVYRYKRVYWTNGYRQLIKLGVQIDTCTSWTVCMPRQEHGSLAAQRLRLWSFSSVQSLDRLGGRGDISRDRLPVFFAGGLC